MDRRSPTEMKFDALKALAVGEHKATRVMGLCNFDWKHTSSILRLLEREGLASRTGNARPDWSITEEGRRKLLQYVAATRDMTSQV